MRKNGGPAATPSAMARRPKPSSMRCSTLPTTFEASVAAGYDPQTAVERELVLRLASLQWRLRRATAIAIGLFQIHNDISGELSETKTNDPQPLERGPNIMVRTGKLESAIRPDAKLKGSHGYNYQFAFENNACDRAEAVIMSPSPILILPTASCGSQRSTMEASSD